MSTAETKPAATKPAAKLGKMIPKAEWDKKVEALKAQQISLADKAKAQQAKLASTHRAKADGFTKRLTETMKRLQETLDGTKTDAAKVTDAKKAASALAKLRDDMVKYVGSLPTSDQTAQVTTDKTANGKA